MCTSFGKSSLLWEFNDTIFNLESKMIYKLLAKYYKAVALENVAQQEKIARMLAEFGYRDLIVAFSTAS